MGRVRDGCQSQGDGRILLGAEALTPLSEGNSICHLSSARSLHLLSIFRNSVFIRASQPSSLSSLLQNVASTREDSRVEGKA